VTAFTAAQAALRNEIIHDPDFVVLGLAFDDILDGIELIKRHNLNSTDGAILQAFKKHAGPMRSSVVSVLVASEDLAKTSRRPREDLGIRPSFEDLGVTV